MYEGLLKRFNEFHPLFVAKQEGKEFGLDIRITNKDGETKTTWIKYVLAGRLDWMWYETWKKHYKFKDME